jgi:hypothetical protein
MLDQHTQLRRAFLYHFRERNTWNFLAYGVNIAGVPVYYVVFL